ncbi:hypothetical protein V6N13_027364 [Hibiscus sabdariffa]
MAPKKGDNAAKAAAEAAAMRAAAVEAASQKAVAAEANPEEPTLEKKVSDLETATKDAVERLDVVDERLDELENKGDRIQEEIQGRRGCFVEPCHGIESSKWAIFGKQNWRCGMNRNPGYGAQLRANKGFWSIKTAGRWSWKSKSAKECVTTHLPNQLAPKMDGA